MDTGSVRHIDREDDIRAHIAGEVYREIILDAAIDDAIRKGEALLAKTKQN